MSTATMRSELLNLPAQERARLIDLLWDSLSQPEIKARETAWADESERRVESYERGDLKARDAAQVFEELQKKLRQ